MAMYKVCYSGFAYVEADTPKEAEDNYDCNDVVYEERQTDSIEEVDDFFTVW